MGVDVYGAADVGMTQPLRHELGLQPAAIKWEVLGMVLELVVA